MMSLDKALAILRTWPDSFASERHEAVRRMAEETVTHHAAAAMMWELRALDEVDAAVTASEQTR